MKKTFSQKKSAFSLIELSIVLIIIGLLIAGITGGASLIKSSELRSVMGEARGYAVAVNSFYTNYGFLPGDYNIAVGNATAGDGDGTIEYYRTASAAGSESASAWVALRTIGAVDSISSSTNVIATTQPVFGTTSSATAPASKVKSSGWVFDYRDATASPYTSSGTIESTPTVQNVVILSGTIPADDPTAGSNAATTVVSAAIFSYDLLSIDSKIDDGNPGAGKVRGINPGASGSVTAVPTSADTSSAVKCYYYSSSTFIYNTTNATKSCAMSYQVDVNS